MAIAETENMERIESDSENEIEVDLVKEDTKYTIKIVDKKTSLFEYVLKKGKQLPYKREIKGELKTNSN